MSNDRFIMLTLAHEFSQSPRKLLVNTAYLVSFCQPPSYSAYDRGYGRQAPYPSNARTKLVIGSPHEQSTEYVVETPEQIQALLEAQ